MKTEHVKFVVESAFGKQLVTPVPVEFDVELFEERSEIPDGERLNDEQYVQAVNARRKAKMRAKETTKALDAAGVEKPNQNDPAVIRDNMIKMTQKMYPHLSAEQAAKLVDATATAAAAVEAASE